MLSSYDFEERYILAVPVEYARVLTAEAALETAVNHNNIYLQQVDLKPLMAKARAARRAWEAIDECLVYSDDWYFAEEA